MFTCHCPNCGQELAIPRWLPRTVTCENCHTKSIVPYDQDPDFNKYNTIAKSKVKLNDFRTAHPGFTKGIGIAGIVALAAGTFYLSLKDDNASLPQLTESTNELPEDQNHSLFIDAGQDRRKIRAAGVNSHIKSFLKSIDTDNSLLQKSADTAKKAFP